MLTGVLPFQADSAQETMIKRLTDDPMPLVEARPDIAFPPKLQAVLDKALARDARRPLRQRDAEFGTRRRRRRWPASRCRGPAAPARISAPPRSMDTRPRDRSTVYQQAAEAAAPAEAACTAPPAAKKFPLTVLAAVGGSVVLAARGGGRGHE